MNNEKRPFMLIFFNLYKNWQLKKKKPPCVYTTCETVEKILSDRCSVARFGDGEFDLMLEINKPKFQESSTKLKERLLEVFNSNKTDLLVCIPKFFTKDDREILTKKASKHWRKFINGNRSSLYSILDFDKQYGNASFTRCYIDLGDKINCKKNFDLIRSIWEQKKIAIIEGEFTRIGVGNDLLCNAQSIQRIIVPNENAFAKYDCILSMILDKIDKDTLLLLAVGPTATVLAYDLSRNGYQAIDIGHIDIEYEWFLRRAKEKVAVPHKYTNEAHGRIVSDDFHDNEYENSIEGIIRN